MPKKAGLICATLLLLLGTVSASRKPAERHVIIPFDFMVGRHMFPQGEYRLSSASSGAVRIEALRGIAAVMVPSNGTPERPSRSLTLVFDSHGSTRQLLGIYGTREIGRQLAANPSKSLIVITAWPVAVLAADSIAH